MEGEIKRPHNYLNGVVDTIIDSMRKRRRANFPPYFFFHFKQTLTLTGWNIKQFLKKFLYLDDKIINFTIFSIDLSLNVNHLIPMSRGKPPRVLSITFHYDVFATQDRCSFRLAAEENVGMNNPLVRAATWAARGRSVSKQLVPRLLGHHVRQWICTRHRNTRLSFYHVKSLHRCQPFVAKLTFISIRILFFSFQFLLSTFEESARERYFVSYFVSSSSRKIKILLWEIHQRRQLRDSRYNCVRWKEVREGVDLEAPAFSTKNRGTTLALKRLWTIGSDDKQLETQPSKRT